jgi:hypothetical protein
LARRAIRRPIWRAIWRTRRTAIAIHLLAGEDRRAGRTTSGTGTTALLLWADAALRGNERGIWGLHRGLGLGLRLGG